MKLTIGVLAHVDAGKTTFSEQLLYETNQIDRLGHVDQQDAFMDSHPIEKERGITIFSDQALIQYKGHEVYLVDTPGHVDFSAEMERTIKILDVAIVIISAIDGVESHTETVWELLQQHQIPTFVFINKMDRDGVDLEKVMNSIHSSLTKTAFDFTNLYQKGTIAEPLKAWLAEQSDCLLDYYLDEIDDIDLWKKECKSLILDRKIIPCFRGTALKQEGIIEFFEFIIDVIEKDYSSELPLNAKAYKVRYDDKGLKWTYLKILQGRLRVKDGFEFETDNGKITEKINQMRIVQGRKMLDIDDTEAGSLVAVSGLESLKIGEGIGDGTKQEQYLLVPTLQVKVLMEPDRNMKWFYEQFKILEDENPTLGVKLQQETGEIIIQVMGEIQLEVLKKTFLQRFNRAIDFTEPSIIYKETIANKVYGYGHFEPLKHYAEVHLKLEPNNRNEGICFLNQCSTDNLTYGNQNLVKTHIFEKEHHGIVTGAVLTDIKITLLTGRGHEKHTHGGDFREATIRALRQGLEQAETVLLEPYYDFRIKANKEYLGRIMTDIQQAHGRFDDPIMDQERFSLSGTVPVATFLKYSTKLALITSGTGSILLRPSGYDLCHNRDEVIEEIGYNKVTDKDYPSSSVFCAKGKGYTVPWDEAKAAMHCEIKE